MQIPSIPNPATANQILLGQVASGLAPELQGMVVPSALLTAADASSPVADQGESGFSDVYLQESISLPPDPLSLVWPPAGPALPRLPEPAASPGIVGEGSEIKVSAVVVLDRNTGIDLAIPDRALPILPADLSELFLPASKPEELPSDRTPPVAEDTGKPVGATDLRDVVRGGGDTNRQGTAAGQMPINTAGGAEVSAVSGAQGRLMQREEVASLGDQFPKIWPKVVSVPVVIAQIPATDLAADAPEAMVTSGVKPAIPAEALAATNLSGRPVAPRFDWPQGDPETIPLPTEIAGADPSGDPGDRRLNTGPYLSVLPVKSSEPNADPPVTPVPDEASSKAVLMTATVEPKAMPDLRLSEVLLRYAIEDASVQDATTHLRIAIEATSVQDTTPHVREANGDIEFRKDVLPVPEFSGITPDRTVQVAGLLVGGLEEGSAQVVDLGRLAPVEVQSGSGPTAVVELETGRAASRILAQVTSQIAERNVQGPGGSTTVTLSPEELGQVRISFQADAQDPDRLAVMLSFERPETMDLFRRHAEQLAEVLRTAGYSGVQIGFGGPGGEGFRQSAEDSMTPHSGPHDPEPLAENLTAALPTLRGGLGALDLRL